MVRYRTACIAKKRAVGGGSPRPRAPGGGGAHSAGCCEHRLRRHAHSVCIRAVPSVAQASWTCSTASRYNQSTTIKGTRPLLPRAAPLAARAYPWPCERSRPPHMPIVKPGPAVRTCWHHARSVCAFADRQVLPLPGHSQDQLQTRWRLVRAHGPRDDPEREPS